MSDYLLTVELEDENVVLHADPAGLRHLIGRLQSLLSTAEASGNEHEHFMTSEWGGEDLTSEVQGGGEVVNHVRVYCWVP